MHARYENTATSLASAREELEEMHAKYDDTAASLASAREELEEMHARCKLAFKAADDAEEASRELAAFREESAALAARCNAGEQVRTHSEHSRDCRFMVVILPTVTLSTEWQPLGNQACAALREQLVIEQQGAAAEKQYILSEAEFQACGVSHSETVRSTDGSGSD